MSFSIGKKINCKDKDGNEKQREVFNLKFIDSFQFMASSLDQLVKDLGQDGLLKFKYTQQEFEFNADVMIRKGVYPYSFVDDWNKFNVDIKTLAPKDFTNDLTGEEIIDEKFKFFQDVCNKFNIKTLGEYHDLYLKSDVHLLVDVFENFRKMCLDNYGLDPCHYVSAPGLSWQAMLKITKIELELISDIDMYLFIEKG